MYHQKESTVFYLVMVIINIHLEVTGHMEGGLGTQQTFLVGVKNNSIGQMG